MIPVTRYAAGPGGALAYQVLGDGPPDVILIPGWTSHLDLQWQLSSYRSFVRKLARHCRLVRYDKLGTGLSDPTPHPPTTADRVADLHAVIDSTHAHAPVLLGFSEGGPLAIRYALEHPEVAGLVLYGTATRPPKPDEAAVLEDLLDHWGEGKSLEVFAPSSAGDEAAREITAAIERAGASPAMIRHVMAGVGLADARPALAQLSTPTLILHRAHDLIPVAEAHASAEAISGSRLVVLPGIDHHPWAGDQDSVIDALAEFFRELCPAPRGPRPRTEQRRPRTGFNALTDAERRVATRAAAGLSNPEISRELHIARTTVETHLKRVYLKLGLDGRHQLSTLEQL